METMEELQAAIRALKSRWDDFGDDLELAAACECEVESRIIAWARMRGYACEASRATTDQCDEGDDHNTSERASLGRLALEHDDVLRLMWFYVELFWPQMFESRDDYVEHLIDELRMQGVAEVGALD